MLGMTETGQGGGLAARIVRAIETWLFRSASRVVVIHDRFASRLQSDFGVSPERVEVIRNWTHLAPMPATDVQTTRAKFGWDTDETIVVHSGNMGIKQGLQHVVEAARIAHSTQSSVRFVLIGNGSQREELLKLAADQPARIQFVPPLDDQDFADALRASDVLLVNELPGVSEMAVPSKLTSYFSAGRPVVAATDPSGITAEEVTSAGAGLVVAAGDAPALLRGVIEISENAARAAEFGESGQRYRAAVLSDTAAIDRFDSLLTQLSN